MKPICDIEEQASVRLRLVENTASSAPRNMVTQPKKRTASPQGASCRKRLQLTARMPNMPVLVRMPESRALAGAGATACALGSQMCRGNMPALAANPKNVSAPAR